MSMRWYSVSVLSNFEKRVAETIKEAIIQNSLEDEIQEVLVPTEEVLEVRKLTEETIVLRIDKGNIDFEPGQYVRIGVEGDSEIRDYSIYSTKT